MYKFRQMDIEVGDQLAHNRVIIEASRSSGKQETKCAEDMRQSIELNVRSCAQFTDTVNRDAQLGGPWMTKAS